MNLTEREKQRRYDVVKDLMQAQDLGAILVISNAQINQQGFVRYFTNMPIPIYSHGLFFPKKGKPVLVTPSPLQTFWATRLCWIPSQDIRMSKNLGEVFGTLIKERGLEYKRIGLLTFDTMNAKDYKDLITSCPEINLINISGLFEQARCSKSIEETGFSRQATKLAIGVQDVFRQNVKPGESESHAIAKVKEYIADNGGERSFFLISSDARIAYPYIPQQGRFSRESPVIFSVEVAGPCGYWSQIVRTYFWQKPSGITEKIYRTLLDLRLIAQNELRPGRVVSDVARILKTEIEKNGFKYGIHFGHGLGLDVVEEPIVNTENNMVLRENHFVTIHPHIVVEDESIGLWLGDMYFVGEHDTEILSPLQEEILL